jgi:predicted O-methyltransferase YrrM
MSCHGVQREGGIPVLPGVIKAYEDHNFRLDLGSPSHLIATLRDRSTGTVLSCGGGMAVTDVALFVGLAQVLSPTAIFVIGNAFGYSTFVLADLFPGAAVDAIDAECEGRESERASELTRRIAASHYPGVKLTIGHSPTDLKRAMRSQPYQLAFVDGGHTPAQVIDDFRGLQPFLDEETVVVFHDIALFRLYDTWAQIRSEAEPNGFGGYEMAFTQFGTCVLARGLDDVQRYLDSIAGAFANHDYRLGAPPPRPPRRSMSIWTKLWTRPPRDTAKAIGRRTNAAMHRLW